VTDSVIVDSEDLTVLLSGFATHHNNSFTYYQTLMSLS